MLVLKLVLFQIVVGLSSAAAAVHKADTYLGFPCKNKDECFKSLGEQPDCLAYHDAKTPVEGTGGRRCCMARRKNCAGNDSCCSKKCGPDDLCKGWEVGTKCGDGDTCYGDRVRFTCLATDKYCGAPLCDSLEATIKTKKCQASTHP